MIRNSFQGTQFTHKFNDNWNLDAGYLTRIKDRTSTDFEKPYKRAEIEGEEDLSLAGVPFHDEAGHLSGVYGYHAPAVFDMVYAEYSGHFQLNKESTLVIAGQYSRQTSIGAELAGDFSGDHYDTELVWEALWSRLRLRTPSTTATSFSRAEELFRATPR